MVKAMQKKHVSLSRELELIGEKVKSLHGDGDTLTSVSSHFVTYNDSQLCSCRPW